MWRGQTKKIQIGNVCIGGGCPVAIQSMTNTKTEDVESTVKQIQALEKAGCEIIRCAVPTMEAAEALAKIKEQIQIPLVADIHFDYRLAIAAIENGADKIRINPGNIGDESRAFLVFYNRNIVAHSHGIGRANALQPEVTLYFAGQHSATVSLDSVPAARAFNNESVHLKPS